jgi:hypothetical protein
MQVDSGHGNDLAFWFALLVLGASYSIICPDAQHKRAGLARIGHGERGQAPIVRSTRRAVPAIGGCPLFTFHVRTTDGCRIFPYSCGKNYSATEPNGQSTNSSICADACSMSSRPPNAQTTFDTLATLHLTLNCTNDLVNNEPRAQPRSIIIIFSRSSDSSTKWLVSSLCREA